jgi:hypothetical protein
MWIVTESGFVSVVRNRNDDKALLVRSRDRESLEAFCGAVGKREDDILLLDDADYRFRVSASDQELKRFLTRCVDRLDYENFKSRVWESRGARWHDVLIEVWRTLRRLEDPPTRRSA